MLICSYFTFKQHIINIFMRIIELLSEITRPPNKFRAVNFLQRYGYKLIGKGLGGIVVGKPDSDYVLKLFSANDIGYHRYLDLILARNNPHFPIIRGKPTKISELYYVVKLERLWETNNYNYRLGKYCDMYCNDKMNEYIQQNEFKNSLNRQRIKNINRNERYNKLASDFPELMDALDMIIKYVLIPLRTEPDLHDSNIMQRKDGTLVLVDPVFYDDIFNPLNSIPATSKQMKLDIPNLLSSNKNPLELTNKKFPYYGNDDLYTPDQTELKLNNIEVG